MSQQAAKAASQHAVKYLLGKCLPSAKSNAARIQIPKFELDTNLNMYFRHFTVIFASDPERKCKTGDTVLIRNLPERLTRLIEHEVVDVVFPMGDVTDPVSGKKVVAGMYREDIEAVTQMYGKAESAYTYEKAPPRGRLEGIKDFTDKPTYKKFHEDPNDPDQPYATTNS